MKRACKNVRHYVNFLDNAPLLPNRNLLRIIRLFLHTSGYCIVPWTNVFLHFWLAEQRGPISVDNTNTPHRQRSGIVGRRLPRTIVLVPLLPPAVIHPNNSCYIYSPMNQSLVPCDGYHVELILLFLLVDFNLIPPTTTKSSSWSGRTLMHDEMVIG